MALEHEEIVEDCLNYLDCEEQALQSTLELLGTVRAAALAGDVVRLESLHGRQEETARQTQILCSERDRLRKQIAAFLQISDTDATLEKLANHLGGECGEQVRSAGVRVRTLAVKVNQVNHTNAAVLEHCLGFTRRVLHDLTGGGPPAVSYGPDGTSTESVYRSLLSARG